MLASVILCIHCLVFAAFDFSNDGGDIGRILFPLASSALITAIFCVAASIAQFISLLLSFVKDSPVRYHRLCAILLTWVAVGLIFVAGLFGWFIHV